MGEHECPTCGRTFESKRGVGIHHSKTHKENGGKEKTECEICGTEFEYYPSDKKGLYCSECVKAEEWRHRPDVEGSNNPRWKGGKREYECAVCGETFERYPSDAAGEVAVCSESCRCKWLSEAFTGDGHPNWRGGGNEAYGTGWAATRRAALERDDYAYVRCGTDTDDLGRNPDVHHIVPVRLFVEADGQDRTNAHDLDNVVTLCPACHRRADFGTVSRNRLRRAVDAR